MGAPRTKRNRSRSLTKSEALTTSSCVSTVLLCGTRDGHCLQCCPKKELISCPCFHPLERHVCATNDMVAGCMKGSESHTCLGFVDVCGHVLGG